MGKSELKDMRGRISYDIAQNDNRHIFDAGRRA
jgi:hypothetical protein